MKLLSVIAFEAEYLISLLYFTLNLYKKTVHNVCIIRNDAQRKRFKKKKKRERRRRRIKHFGGKRALLSVYIKHVRKKRRRRKENETLFIKARIFSKLRFVVYMETRSVLLYRLILYQTENP